MKILLLILLSSMLSSAPVKGTRMQECFRNITHPNDSSYKLDVCFNIVTQWSKRWGGECSEPFSSGSRSVPDAFCQMKNFTRASSWNITKESHSSNTMTINGAASNQCSMKKKCSYFEEICCEQISTVDNPYNSKYKLNTCYSVRKVERFDKRKNRTVSRYYLQECTRGGTDWISENRKVSDTFCQLNNYTRAHSWFTWQTPKNTTKRIGDGTTCRYSSYCEYFQEICCDQTPNLPGDTLESTCLKQNGIWSAKTGQCFKFYAWTKTWRGSFCSCERKFNLLEGFRGRLAVISSQDSFTVLQSYLQTNPGYKYSKNFWIGLRTNVIPHTTDEAFFSEGWMWHEGDRAVGNVSWIPDLKITNGSTEDCMLFKYNVRGYSMYEDGYCIMSSMVKRRQGICEILKGAKRTVSAYCNPSDPTSGSLEEKCAKIMGIWSPTTNQCFKQISLKRTLALTWKDSYCKCESSSKFDLQARLPVVYDQEGLHLLFSYAEYRKFWIGLHRNTTNSSNWMWYEGDTIVGNLSWFPMMEISQADDCVQPQFQNKYIGTSCDLALYSTFLFCEYAEGPSSQSLYCNPLTTVETTSFSTTTSSSASSNVIVSSAISSSAAPNASFMPSSSMISTVSTSPSSIQPPSTSSVTSPEETTPLSTVRSSIASTETMTQKSHTSAPTTVLTTTKPVFPLSDTEIIVVSVMHALGCTFILASLAITLAVFLFLRDFSHERFLHMNMEAALMAGHILVLTMRDRTETPVPCKIAGFGFQFFFLASFSFMTLEALQAYCISTNVISFGGYFSRLQYFIIGWGVPAVITAPSAALKHEDYIALWSCWLNLGSPIHYGTIVPVLILSAATIVMAEAAGMGRRRPLPDQNRDQATAAM